MVIALSGLDLIGFRSGTILVYVNKEDMIIEHENNYYYTLLQGLNCHS